MAKAVTIEDVRNGMLMKPRPFTALEGQPEEFTLDLMPLTGDARRDIMLTPGEDRGLKIEGKAIAYAIGITEEQAGVFIPAAAIPQIASEVLARNGMAAREAHDPKAESPDLPASETKEATPNSAS